MKSRNMILSGALLAVLVAMLTFSSAPIALAVPVQTGDNPVGGLGVFVIKKATILCDSAPQAPGNQLPPEIGGCVDVTVNSNLLGNQSDARFNDYMFTGEQLAELVVARDLNGAEFLASTATMMVDGVSKVQCTQIPDSTALDYKAGGDGPSHKWYGHDISSLLHILPPAMGTSDQPGYQSQFDRLYNCLLTVTPSMVGAPSSVKVTVTESAQSLTASSEVQKWYFNPAISISLSFSSGSGIVFPGANPGSTVFSTNSLIINNNAAGGVDLAVYLAGHDLIDTSGNGLCPTTNTLNVNNIRYRCKVGSYYSEVYQPICHLKEANGCQDLQTRQCLCEDDWHQGAGSGGFNDLLPDANSAWTSLLYNGHTAECWFSLSVPLPCAGTFSASNAIDVLVRAI